VGSSSGWGQVGSSSGWGQVGSSSGWGGGRWDLGHGGSLDVLDSDEPRRGDAHSCHAECGVAAHLHKPTHARNQPGFESGEDGVVHNLHSTPHSRERRELERLQPGVGRDSNGSGDIDQGRGRHGKELTILSDEKRT
jgi:hypothetical protein